MGLLTDTKQRKKVVDLILKYNNILCIMFYFVGLLWFFLLAYLPFNAETYFSENALLPGVVEGMFNGDDRIAHFATSLRKELQKDRRNTPKQWLFEQFQNIGLDVYRQNFTVKYPLNLLRGQTLRGENVFGVVHAKRAASTEAIVILAPFRPLSNPAPKTDRGIALMLSLAEFFKEQPYMAKDIIFLVSDQENLGTQAWLDSYHGTRKSQYIVSDDLQWRSGSIQAAINLEIPALEISYVDIKIEGLNGQLPNLDLVNLAVRLCRYEGIQPTIHKRGDIFYAETLAGYMYSLETLFTMMLQQATGSPSGSHGLFHQYNIEALTLEGVKLKSRSDGLVTFGKVMEGIIRSLNNLLERFHQSFFFYLLSGTRRYISIGLYMPPFGLILASLLVKVIALWILSSRNSEKSHKMKSTRDTSVDESTTSILDDNGSEPCYSMSEKPSAWSQVPPVVVVSIMLGIFMYLSPSWFASAATSFHLSIDDALLYGLLALFIASLTISSMFTRMIDEGSEITWETLKSISLLLISLVLSALSLINISLSVFTAVFLVPCAVFFHPTDNRYQRWTQSVLLLLVSPPALVVIASYYYTILVDPSEGHSADILYSLYFNLKQALFLSILDGQMIGNWTFAIITLCIMPCWQCVWAVCQIIPSKEPLNQ